MLAGGGGGERKGRTGGADGEIGKGKRLFLYFVCRINENPQKIYFLLYVILP